MDFTRQAVVLDMDDGSSFEAWADITGWEFDPAAPPWTARASNGEIVSLTYLVDDETGTLRIPERGERARFRVTRYVVPFDLLLEGTEAPRRE